MSDRNKKPQTDSKTQSDLSAQKRAEVLGGAEKKKNTITLIFAVIIAVAAATGAAVWFTGGSGSQTTAASSATAAKAGAATLSIDAAQFDDGKARHYEHPVAGGIKVRFFVLKSSDGIIRAAFDACDVCWRAGKGYVQQGDEMICRNCGRRFPSVRINEVKGGCNPAPLRRTVKDGKVLIDVADVTQGRQYFNF